MKKKEEELDHKKAKNIKTNKMRIWPQKGNKNKDKQKEELDQGVHRLEQVATKCTCGKSRWKIKNVKIFECLPYIDVKGTRCVIFQHPENRER